MSFKYHPDKMNRLQMLVAIEELQAQLAIEISGRQEAERKLYAMERQLNDLMRDSVGLESVKYAD